jgi:thiol-disulfide isomerase/thioredoxin
MRLLIFIFVFLSVAVTAHVEPFWRWQTPPILAPDVMWQDETGQSSVLSNLRGNVVLVNVWATFCPPCLKEMPSLDKLQRRYKQAGLVVLPVALDSAGFPKMRSFYRQLRIRHLPLLADPTGKLLGAFATEALPTTYVIDREGRWVATLEGAEDWFADKPQQLIEDLLRARPTAAPPEGNHQQLILDIFQP